MFYFLIISMLGYYHYYFAQRMKEMHPSSTATRVPSMAVDYSLGDSSYLVQNMCLNSNGPSTQQR